MNRNTLLFYMTSCLVFAYGCSNTPSANTIPPCNGGPFPAAPDNAGALVYVSAACPSETADGSREHPYATIASALPNTPDNAAILIAAGTYNDNLVLSKNLALVGAVDANINGGKGPTIAALAKYAVTISGDAQVKLNSLHIQGAVGTAIVVDNASATIENCLIEGTTSLGETILDYGSGIVAINNGSIILQNNQISGSAGFGVYAVNSRAIILQNTIKGSGGAGIRVDNASEEVRIEESLLEDNTQMGIGIFSSRAIILQNTIKGTKLDADNIGDGVIVAGVDENGTLQATADIELIGNEITGNARVGVLCAAGARGIILQNNTVNANGGQATFGAGLWLQGGAGSSSINNIVEGNTFSVNRYLGIGMTGDTHGIILQNNMVEGTTLGEVFVGTDTVQIGDGIGLFSGASAKILNNKLMSNGRIGLILDQAAGAVTTIEKNIIQDNDQYGIILQNQLNAPATAGNTFMGNKVGNVDSVAAGTFGVRTDAFATQ